jgi:phosphate transport system protein
VSRHISGQYDVELETVRRLFLEMGGCVEEQLELAGRALLKPDPALIDDVRNRDTDVNRLELLIDNHCTHIIARRQPAASDLRLIISLMKASSDLERIGDEAVRIARMAPEGGFHPEPDETWGDMQDMHRIVCRLLSKALDAMARTSVDTALEVLQGDDEVDRAYRHIIQQLVATMSRRPEEIRLHLDMVWAVRSLERIGDHSKNIAEYVIYLVQGKDVRHLPRDALLGQTHKEP